MPSFVKVIREACAGALGGEPDPGGLAAYNRSMNQGMSEASLREELLRSREFALRFPGPGLARPPPPHRPPPRRPLRPGVPAPRPPPRGGPPGAPPAFAPPARTPAGRPPAAAGAGES